MSRPLRIEYPDAWHHVMNRGIRGKPIFSEQRDYDLFVEPLEESVDLWHVRIAAYCRMPSRYHLLLQTQEANLARCMRHVEGVHTLRFSRAHRYDGPLFRGRYKAILVELDPHALRPTRYIHPWPGRLNPVRAGVVQDLSSLRRYFWTGHSALMEKVERSWQDTDTVLGYFGRSKKEAVLYYEAFVRDGVTQGPRPDLVGGGLIRSLGGWSQVLSLRRKGIKVPYDERVLGSGEFLQHLLEEVEERERETLRLSKKVKDLDSLAEEITRQEGLTEEKLRSGSRARRISSTRRLFWQLAVGKLGYSGAQVARFLGGATSAVNRAANSEEHESLHRYL